MYFCFKQKLVVMFKRQIISELNQWSGRANRKPLIIRGARQVGKTTVIEQFGAGYRQFINMNLELPADAAIFRTFKDIEELSERIFFLFDKDISLIGETLLFIDEIQEVPQALNVLRYFYEKIPQLHVIAAGSLLETIIEGEWKVPVGRMEFLVMRPLSFAEFLQAMGENAAVQQLNNIPIKDFAHEKLLSLYNTYALIGGMPEVVHEYATHRNLTALSSIFESLIVSYRNDVEKYGRNNNLVQAIRHVITAAFTEAGNRIKFAGFGHSNYGSREMGEALRTLERVLYLQLVYPTTFTHLPLIHDKRKSPRLQLLDTGLMNYFVGIQKDIIGSTNLEGVYSGKVIEHIVGQELLASKFNVLHQLQFWTRERNDATAEVDFVVPYNGLLIPVEVKSGHTGRLRSLHLFLDAAPHAYAVRLYSGKLTVDSLQTPSGKPFKLLNLPYYLAGHLEDYLSWFMEGE